MLGVRATLRSLSKAAAAPSSDSLIGREIYCGNSVVRLILRDSQRRNALSLRLIDELHDELLAIHKIKKVRAVIIAAEGAAFSAGHDLKELRANEGSENHLKIFERCGQLVQRIQTMRQPVIAEVGGMAAAAGCQVVASCDVVVASEKSRFMVPGQRVGLFCSTPSVALSRAVPPKIALDMLLTARALDAHEAERAGLVSRVVPEGEERNEAIRVAEQICAFSADVTALGKAFFYSQQTLPLSHAYKAGSRVMTENLKLADAQEGISAFLEKRNAVFSSSPSSSPSEPSKP